MRSTEQEIIRLYRDKGFSERAISRRFGIGRYEVWKTIREAGCVRTMWSPFGQPGISRECEFKGEGCLGEFKSTSPKQKYCGACQLAARRARQLAHQLAKYAADPKAAAEKAKQNRWKRRKAAGQPCRPIGSMGRCEYRDKRGKRGDGCEIKFKRRSSAQKYCDPCQKHADADRAQAYRDENREKVRARDRKRWENVKDVRARLALAEAAHQQPKRGRGRPEKKEQRNSLKIGLRVEKKIATDRKLNKTAISDARWLVARETSLSYDTVAEYHREFRTNNPGYKIA